MRARRFCLHDGEDMRIERFYGSDAVTIADLHSAASDCVDGVPAGICNRGFGQIEDIPDDSDLADRLSFACGE